MDWSRYSNPLPRAPARPRPRPRAKKNPEAVGAIRLAKDAVRPAKAQSVRIADVMLIGPLMIWGGTEASKAAKTDLGKNSGSALALMGLGTMVYNGVNFVRVKQGKAC